MQTVYAITSLDYRAADPALLATWVLGHWRSRLHWVRDTAFAEDHSQVGAPPARRTSPPCAPWRSTPYA